MITVSSPWPAQRLRHYRMCNAEFGIVTTIPSVYEAGEVLADRLCREHIRLGVVGFPHRTNTPVVPQRLGSLLQPLVAVAAVVAPGRTHDVTRTVLRAVESAARNGESQWFGRLPRILPVVFQGGDARLLLDETARALVTHSDMLRRGEPWPAALLPLLAAGA